MDLQTFQKKYQKKEVIEYPNQVSSTPLVSVKVLAYNHIEYLKDCLDSILMQKTSFDFDIVLGEDESSDGTRELCIEYAERYPNKIRLYLHTRENNIRVNNKPTGLFNSFYTNYMIQSAKYIAICEADDYWRDPYALEKRVTFLENNPDHVMSFHDAIGIRPGQNIEEGSNFLPYDKDTTLEGEEMIERVIPTASIVYKNHLFDKFEEGMENVVLGDMLLRARLSLFGKARYLHDVMPSVYRYHDSSSYSSLPLAERMNLTFQTRKFLISHIADTEERRISMERSLALKYMGYFFGMIKFEKRLKFEFLKESKYYAKRSGTSMPQIFKYWLSEKVKG